MRYKGVLSAPRKGATGLKDPAATRARLQTSSGRRGPPGPKPTPPQPGYAPSAKATLYGPRRLRRRISGRVSTPLLSRRLRPLHGPTPRVCAALARLVVPGRAPFERTSV